MSDASGLGEAYDASVEAIDTTPDEIDEGWLAEQAAINLATRKAEAATAVDGARNKLARAQLQLADAEENLTKREAEQAALEQEG